MTKVRARLGRLSSAAVSPTTRTKAPSQTSVGGEAVIEFQWRVLQHRAASFLDASIVAKEVAPSRARRCRPADTRQSKFEP